MVHDFNAHENSVMIMRTGHGNKNIRASGPLIPPLAPPLTTKAVLKSLGYICSNSKKIHCMGQIIDFSFMPKIIRILSKDHVP